MENYAICNDCGKEVSMENKGTCYHCNFGEKVVKTSKRIKSKRATIKQILNRKKIYRLSTYVRLVKKTTGRDVSASEIVRTIRNMNNEKLISAEVNKAGRIIGCLIPIC